MKYSGKCFEKYDGAKAVIEFLSAIAQEENYVFRGYNKQEELLPAIIRDKKSFIDVEDELLHDFEKYGSHYFHASTPIDFMSYAQHYGLPTRLLDFTYNPFIALAFALHGPKSNGNYVESKDKSYYYIRFAALEENLCIPYIPLNETFYRSEYFHAESLASKSIQCIDKVTDLFNDNLIGKNIITLTGINDKFENLKSKQQKITSKSILFIDPNQSNQRIIMQQGLFMFPYTLEKKAHLDIINRNTSVVMVHKDLRSELLEYLDTLGFSTFRLMPDLASVCYAIKRKVIDERMEKSANFKKEKIL